LAILHCILIGHCIVSQYLLTLCGFLCTLFVAMKFSCVRKWEGRVSANSSCRYWSWWRSSKHDSYVFCLSFCDWVQLQAVMMFVPKPLLWTAFTVLRPLMCCDVNTTLWYQLRALCQLFCVADQCSFMEESASRHSRHISVIYLHTLAQDNFVLIFILCITSVIQRTSSRHWVTLSFAETKVLDFGLRPNNRSET